MAKSPRRTRQRAAAFMARQGASRKRGTRMVQRESTPAPRQGQGPGPDYCSAPNGGDQKSQSKPEHLGRVSKPMLKWRSNVVSCTMTLHARFPPDEPGRAFRCRAGTGSGNRIHSQMTGFRPSADIDSSLRQTARQSGPRRPWSRRLSDFSVSCFLGSLDAIPRIRSSAPGIGASTRAIRSDVRNSAIRLEAHGSRLSSDTEIRPATFFMTRVKGSLTYRDRYDSYPLPLMIWGCCRWSRWWRVIADRGWTNRFRGQADRNVDAEARRPLVR